MSYSDYTKINVPTLVIYCVIFFSIWTIFELFGKSQMEVLGDTWVLQIVKSGIIKNLIWTVPALLLISKYKDSLYVSLHGMLTNRFNLLRYLPLLIIFTIYILITAYITNGEVALSSNFNASAFVIVMFVGITEESVFRGWLLNASIKNKTGFQLWTMIIANGLLFLAIHFPRWIVDGILIENFINFSFLAIIVLSIIFSLTFVRSKNIFVPIFFHMYWDLMMFLFV